MAKVDQRLSHIPFKYDIDHIKQESKFWLSRIFILFVILILSVLAFLLGCAARISYEMQRQIQFNPAEELFVEGPYIVETPTVNNMAAPIHTSVPEYLQKQRTRSNVACNEALVHPGMISHPDPKRIAVFGDDVGIIHEILKHQINQLDVYPTVENGFLIPTIPNKVVVHHHADSLFQGDFVINKTNIKSIVKQAFDVIIISNILNDDTSTVENVYDSLTENGVLVLSLGADLNGKNAQIINHLQTLGFESLHVYEETHCGLVGRQNFLVAFKDYKTRSKWYHNEAEIQIEIRKRTQGESPLLYLDSSTMFIYQVPSKSIENAYCRDNEDECSKYFADLPFDVTRVPVSDLEVKKSEVSEMAGRGVFAAQDIPLNSVIALELQVQNFAVLPSTWNVIDSFYPRHNEMNERDKKLYQGLLYYIQGYGYASQLLGNTHWTIDSWILLFSNHGCRGTFNLGVETIMYTEDSVSLDVIPDGIEGSEASPFNPFQERRLREYMGSGDITIQDIKQGEEILTNYLSFADPEKWSEEVLILRSQCSGEEIGEISDYESGGKSYY